MRLALGRAALADLTFADNVTEAILDVRNDKSKTNWYATSAAAPPSGPRAGPP